MTSAQCARRRPPWGERAMSISGRDHGALAAGPNGHAATAERPESDTACSTDSPLCGSRQSARNVDSVCVRADALLAVANGHICQGGAPSGRRVVHRTGRLDTAWTVWTADEMPAGHVGLLTAHRLRPERPPCRRSSRPLLAAGRQPHRARRDRGRLPLLRDSPAALRCGR